MDQKFDFDVFLSHSSTDKPRVRRIEQALKAAGLRVWLDESVIAAGDDFNLAIEKGLERSHRVLLFLSREALASSWVGLERSTAQARDPLNQSRRLVPVLLEDCVIPETLQRLKYVDYREETAEALVALIAAAKGEVPPPAATPSPSVNKRAPGPREIVPSLTIFVRENNSAGRPLAGVQVSAPQCRPGVTNRSGKKKLIFPERQVGDTVEVAIYYEGFEVVNDLLRNVTLPRDPATELNLYLSRPERVIEERLLFYRLSFDTIRKEIETWFRSRSEDLSISQAELERVKSERDQANATVDQLIQELAHLKPGDVSTTNRRALQFFSEGKIEEALSELGSAKLQKSRELARARQEAVAKELEDLAKSYILRGQILVSQLKFDEAEEAYTEAAATSPENVDVAHDLAYFLQRQNRFKKATAEYERGLGLARKQGVLAKVGALLNNLGVLHSAQNRMEEARNAYQEALQDYRLLAEKNPDVYLPYVAGTLNNLGILHSDQNRMEEARNAYQEALQNYRLLAEKKPEIYLPDMATTLNNLGVLHSDQNRMEEARNAYQEALQIRRLLAEKNPDVYLPDVAMTLNNLGILHRAQNRMEEARNAYQEALLNYRLLAEKNPDVYLPNVAMTLNNLGILHSDQNRMEEARNAYQEALLNYRLLAEKNPDVYLPDLAMTLNNLGILHRDQNRMEEARNAYQEALQIRRLLAEKNPDVYLPDVAMTLNNLGNLHSAQNRMEKARNAYQEALQIRRELTAGNPERFLPDLVQTLENLGRFEVQNSNFVAALPLWTDALAARREFSTLRPPGDRSGMARSAGMLAMTYALAGQTDDAIASAREALALIAALDPAERQALEKLRSLLQSIVEPDSATPTAPG
jgi:tetratricopeptide (TPR) repeat protein